MADTTADAPIVIRVSHASKRFVIRKDKSIKERIVNFGRSRRHREDFWALKDVDLEITSGTTIGLIGANGSGKSTLLKLIGGIIEPTDGTIERRGRVAALLELGAGFHPDLTGRENVYLNASILGLSRQQTDEHFDSIVDFSEIGAFIDTQVKFYSSGMYVRLAFAIAIHVDPDILLVDEVLAVGDEPFQRKCMDRIQEFQREGRTIILVTHSLSQVGDLCDRAVVLSHGDVVFDGDPQEAIRVLREGFEDAAAAHEVRTDAAPRLEKVVITTVSGDAQHPSMAPGEDLAVTVTVHSDTPVTDWRLAMDIHTPTGQLVIGTSTEAARSDLPEILDGTLDVTFTFPKLPLLTGQYHVGASVGTVALGDIERWGTAGQFSVVSDSKNVGVLEVVTTATATPR
jgi:ABC-2 type transport system ATP-binding protein